MNMPIRRLGAILVLSFLAVTGQAQTAKPPAGLQSVHEVEGIREYRLPNGLQVLLAPDDSKPTTTVNVTYRVGSRMENYGETGMAHLLEHLMFKGSPATPNPWAEFTKRGLRANGTTSFDRTNYFASFAASDDTLKWLLSWEADAMVHSFIAKKDLDSEMTVVRNEMEMGENNPGRILYQKTLAAMFQWHNYGKTPIGARADVENVDISRLQAFYRLYYQPDNATLIVSGKFDPAKALAWTQQYFGKIPRPPRALPKLYTIDPVQDGERGITLRRVGGAPLLMSAYHVPPGAHPDYAAIELLALILGDAPAGRLHKALVERRLAASVFGESGAMHDPGFGLFGAQLAPGQDAQPARDALVSVVEGFAKQPVTAEELQRAKTKWLKNWDLEFSNPEAVGISLSDAVAQGDWRLFFLLRDRVRDLKLEDVQRVAASYFVPSNRTLAQYVPTEKPERAPLPQQVEVAEQMKGFKPQAAAEAVAPFDASPANIDARTQRFTLPSGLQAAVLPKPTRGKVVNATLTLRFGDEKSLAGQAGTGALLAAMLDKGTKQLTRQQIQDKLDALRTELSIAQTEPGAVTVSLRSRRESVAEAIALAGQLLREPSLPEAALDEVKSGALAAIQQQRDDPEAVAAKLLDRHGNPYPKGDPRYARTFDETAADVGAVSLEKMRAFHQRFYGASHAQFAAVGDFDPAAVRAALDAAFGQWRAADAGFTRIPEPLVTVPPARLAQRTPDKQNAMLSVQLAVALTERQPDYPALMLANWLLGTGGDSRLWKRIREREGLSYGVWSLVEWNSFDPNSMWTANAIFAPENREKVEKAMAEEIARALREGFTPQEVEAGRRGLLNFRRLSRAQDPRLAQALSRNLYVGRTFEEAQRVDEALEKLTVAQVNDALRRYLKPEGFVSAVVGDFKE